MIAHAIPNVFVPTFAPQYKPMCERAEHEPPECAQYGTSLEYQQRTGIWVPVSWLQTIPQATQKLTGELKSSPTTSHAQTPK